MRSAPFATRRRAGLVLLEVMLALTIFTLTGVAMAIALRRGAQLQSQIDAELRLERAFENALAVVRTLPVLEAGNLQVPTEDPAITVEASAQRLEGLSDQFGHPLGGEPGRPVTEAGASPGGGEEGDVPTAIGGAGDGQALEPSVELWEVHLRVVQNDGDPAAPQRSRETTLWVAPDAAALVDAFSRAAVPQ